MRLTRRFRSLQTVDHFAHTLTPASATLMSELYELEHGKNLDR